ncbi:M16 family metallopeptidase [Allonocardiopsis opalescens]|nr:pitrilysin family protein [Allonocardiopsis opalescens]
MASRPVLGPPEPYTFPAVRRSSVGAGDVIAVDLPGQAFASVRLVHPAGAFTESEDQYGVAMLTGDALEDGQEGNGSLAPALERHGAEWESWVGWDSFVTGVDVPVNRIVDATRLLADALRSPAFRSDDIVRRRDQIREAFVLECSVPSSLAARAVGSQLFAGRYAVPANGGPKRLDAVDPEMVVDFHRRQLANVAGTLIVVGDLGKVDVEGLARSVFGDTVRAQPPSPAPVRGAEGAQPRIVVLDRPGSVQSALVLAHRAPSRAEADLPAAYGVGDVIGGMFGSRLNLLLREEKGYTYGAGARFDLRRNGGQFTASCQVETRHTADAVASSVAEIVRLREGGVTDDELATVRESRTVGLPVNYSKVWSVANVLIDIEVQGLPDDHIDRLRAGFDALTAEKMLDGAREYLRPDELVAVVVGDAEQVAGPLAEIGLGPVSQVDPDALWS